MRKIRTRAYGGPGRYVQGPGEINYLEQYSRPYGCCVLALIDGPLYGTIQPRLQAAYSGSASSLHTMPFSGECCEKMIESFRLAAVELKTDVLVGVGGGKTLDTAKMAAALLELPLIIVPTSASTDAPTSAMSVIYSEEGKHLYSVSHKRNPDLVLADTEIIAKAPLRLFLAGVGDALSTWYEARANRASDTNNYIGTGYRRTLAGMAIAEMCFNTLMNEARTAKEDLEAGRLTESVENVIEANILLSGLGFENTGCAGAHSVHTGIHEIPGTGRYYHGEMVSFGIVFQLVLENALEEEKRQALSLLRDMELPLTLSQLGVDPTEENLCIITRRIMDGNSGVDAEPFDLTEEMVYNALLSADRLGKEYLCRMSNNK